ncbi:hypothetical protein TOPH_05835 [Tolypocladium ophioglossoides CBS 100239]|uniref:Rhodopsin domain-containing protein n=1 Tax=Tolypocladium ophioglossoides (strain CBS 100239) TaxID=1163406 RepID=A0A0L0N5N5_TOLOC|nr:hypothetical protein TOPH_05835 [Tolypocladium ophioglossoides CBS 100239]
MALYSSPPPARPFSETKPTLLVAWWITAFCTCLILLRLAGRYIRVEKLFLEDKIAALALLPLYLRIACVHVVLLYGTNNAQLDGLGLSAEEIDQKVIASRVVLAGRIFYAATLWTLKFTTLEFLNRLAGASMKKAYLRLIILLRCALVVSFVAVIISDLAECQPVSHYWQILPDPGPQCRQGFAQLLTMGVSSAILDAILVAFPVPIIVSTRIATKRKVLLVLLFCFGFLTVGITIYRIPKIVEQQGDQLVRSMWASVELLAATTVANLVALGSFLRDSGAKKRKFRQDPNSSGATTSRRQGQTTTSDWDGTADGGQHLKSDGAGWTDEARPHATPDSRPKNSERSNSRNNSQSSGVRGNCPTDSHDSLIQRASSRTPGVLEPPHPRPPSPVVPAGMTGLQRR